MGRKWANIGLRGKTPRVFQIWRLAVGLGEKSIHNFWWQLGQQNTHPFFLACVFSRRRRGTDSYCDAHSTFWEKRLFLSCLRLDIALILFRNIKGISSQDQGNTNAIIKELLKESQRNAEPILSKYRRNIKPVPKQCQAPKGFKGEFKRVPAE